MAKKFEPPVDLWDLQNTFYSENVRLICGVDEAGRGPLAGPVCAAAVILPRGLEIPGLNDSKKLKPATREKLFDQITANALDYGIAFATHEEIDRVNILQATYLAMERAIAQLSIAPDLLLIDGNRAKDFGVPAQTVVGGDGRCAAIAAASILAKVTRDRYMTAMAADYPGYGFEIHKGYGTKRHYEALRVLGPCPIHRQTFLRSFYAGTAR